jgi:AraC family transcriptional regulator
MPRHAHGVTKISLLLAGGLEERARRREWRPPVCGLAIKPAGLDHTDRFSPRGARLFSIQMDSTFIEQLGTDRRALESYDWIPCGPWTKSAIEAYRSFREVVSSEGTAVGGRDVTHCAATPQRSHLEANLYDLVASLSGAGLRNEPSGREPRWLTTVWDRLHDECHAGVCVRHLAQDVGVHPVHLARIFRRRFCCTIAEYVRRLRTERAAALLATSDLPIATIANETGFADQPHLTRVFKAVTGVTPLTYRRLARG